jgi:pSer/pThr/pTyr-binding forkhead associated (FHA) protein
MRFISIQVLSDSPETYTVESTEGESIHIGRRAAAKEEISIVLQFPNVSSRHGVISYGKDTSSVLALANEPAWTFTDLGSTNGSAINGARLTSGKKYGLVDGDRILIADEHELKVLSCSTSSMIKELQEEERELLDWQQTHWPSG